MRSHPLVAVLLTLAAGGFAAEPAAEPVAEPAPAEAVAPADAAPVEAAAPADAAPVAAAADAPAAAAGAPAAPVATPPTVAEGFASAAPAGRPAEPRWDEVLPGMTVAEVAKRVGPPDVVKKRGVGEEARWRTGPLASDPLFIVWFTGGTATRMHFRDRL